MERKLNRTLALGLLCNSIFSGISGLVLLGAARPIAAVFDLEAFGLLRFIGANLLVFSVWLLLAYRRKRPDSREIYLISALDGLWILASLVLVSLDLVPLLSPGFWILSLVGLLVTLFMGLQLKGVRQLSV